MENKLKPCPFCGQKDYCHYQINSEYAVHCNNCGVIGPRGSSYERADEMWNLRLVSLDFFAEHEMMARDLSILMDSGTNDSVSEFVEKLTAIRSRWQKNGRR